MVALLTLAGIRKSYGPVRVLHGVDFEVRAGEVHALVGENGAGKSTLIKIASGAETLDAGEITIAGRRLAGGSTAEALAAGLATVYQEPQLFGELSVAENVFLGRELTRRRLLDRSRQRAEVVALLRRLGLDPAIADSRVADLPVAEQQLVSIAKALSRRGRSADAALRGRDARVLVLDEPSAILTDSEIERLFTAIRAARADGVGIVYISHRLDELAQIADRVTVLRDGRVVADRPSAELSVREIAELMVGGELTESAGRGSVDQDAPVVLGVTGLSRPPAFTEVSFELHAGEIVALYGLVGSGTEHIANALYGIDPATSGTVVVHDRPVTLRRPSDAARAGIGLVPANRKVAGVFESKSVAFNISVGNLVRLSRPRYWVDRAAERRVAADFVRRVAIKTPGVNSLVGTLSGGNQQKVVISRALVDRPEVLLLNEPTQGVDVGAKEEIHQLVRGQAEQGSAVLVVSTDLPEVLRLADRLLVVRAGRITASFGPGASQADVLAAAAGDVSEARS
ncbi:sugar ABC transporter ATP-binding protein [Pseudonocardia eucalypti]|uniref:Sugar ABC transporter ATP-binding protein n=1 Tax=Pseudonocardia eucalypti TaxID=648755 RepID=A0ABP9PV62_9PSEU|nr:rhamnose transport system ATP-binding protein [Pseudonocardia eucalypti]